MVLAALNGLSDEDVVARVLAGEHALYEVLMRRHNQRLFRAARAILRDADEAEDTMQEAYVRAFEQLGSFEGRASFATWLTRIAVHEALARKKRRARFTSLEPSSAGNEVVMKLSSTRGPGDEAEARELGVVLEAAIDALPDGQREVLVLREVEEMSTADTASVLGLSVEAVKVRLHRARAGLREELERRLGAASKGVYAFRLDRCDRVVAAVMRRIAR